MMIRGTLTLLLATDLRRFRRVDIPSLIAASSSDACLWVSVMILLTWLLILALRLFRSFVLNVFR